MIKKWAKAGLATGLSFISCFFIGKLFGFTEFTFAWVLNFVLMAWYTYVDVLFNWKYRSNYFDTRSIEKGGTIYKYFGVQFYRKILVWTGWEKLRLKENKMRNNKASLAHAELKSRSSETGHSVIFLIVLLVTILVADTLKEAFWLLILNLLLNIYPVFVQRYNRPRYRRVLRKMNHEKV